MVFFTFPVFTQSRMSAIALYLVGPFSTHSKSLGLYCQTHWIKHVCGTFLNSIGTPYIFTFNGTRHQYTEGNLTRTTLLQHHFIAWRYQLATKRCSRCARVKCLVKVWLQLLRLNSVKGKNEITERSLSPKLQRLSPRCLKAAYVFVCEVCTQAVYMIVYVDNRSTGAILMLADDNRAVVFRSGIQIYSYLIQVFCKSTPG